MKWRRFIPHTFLFLVGCFDAGSQSLASHREAARMGAAVARYVVVLYNCVRTARSAG